MLNEILSPEMQVVLISGLTELLKRMNINNKYLSYIPVVIGCLFGAIKALPKENLDNVETILTSGTIGLAVSLGYKSIRSLLNK